MFPRTDHISRGDAREAAILAPSGTTRTVRERRDSAPLPLLVTSPFPILDSTQAISSVISALLHCWHVLSRLWPGSPRPASAPVAILLPSISPHFSVSSRALHTGLLINLISGHLVIHLHFAASLGWSHLGAYRLPRKASEPVAYWYQVFHPYSSDACLAPLAGQFVRLETRPAHAFIESRLLSELDAHRSLGGRVSNAFLCWGSILPL